MIDLEKAVSNFCQKYNLCPTSREKLLLELAINYGATLTTMEDIAKLKEKIRRCENGQ